LSAKYQESQIMNALTQTMQTYFHGEKMEAWLFIVPLGVLALLFCAGLLKTDRSPFIVGFTSPVILLGLVLLITGGTVALRTDSQLAQLVAQMASAPAQFAAEETARMAKVNAAWPIYLITWVSFVAVGLILRFALSAPWAHGLGIALVLFGGFGLVIDGFAERRAKVYTNSLAQFVAAQPAVSPASAKP
jgi:hypothetical protein